MNIKKMSIGLLAVLLTLPAFAQVQQDSIRNDFMKRKGSSWTKMTSTDAERAVKLDNALQRAVVIAILGYGLGKAAAFKRIPTKKNLSKEVSLPTCVYCGEKFNPLHHEHCAATGNTGLHAASAPQNGNEGSAAPASVCPKCHQTLSIDERFHGVPHNCPADTADSLPTCVYCGEKFNPFHHEHCDATGNISLHSASAPRANDSGSSPVRRCPECFKELSTDEIYHNTHTHYCIKCGKEFEGRSNPDCSVSGKCTIQCPECGMNLRDEQNLVNGTHHCKFKGRYTPVAPVK